MAPSTLPRDYLAVSDGRQARKRHCQFRLSVCLVGQLTGEEVHVRLHVEVAVAAQVE